MLNFVKHYLWNELYWNTFHFWKLPTMVQIIHNSTSMWHACAHTNSRHKTCMASNHIHTCKVQQMHIKWNATQTFVVMKQFFYNQWFLKLYNLCIYHIALNHGPDIYFFPAIFHPCYWTRPVFISRRFICHLQSVMQAVNSDGSWWHAKHYRSYTILTVYYCNQYIGSSITWNTILDNLHKDFVVAIIKDYQIAGSHILLNCWKLLAFLYLMFIQDLEFNFGIVHLTLGH